MKKRMINIFMLIFVFSLLFNTSMLTAKKRIGIGIIAGSPTGISLKFGTFPVLGIAWNFQDTGYLHLHADYWIINKPLSPPLDWYLGVGGKIKIWSDKNKTNNNSRFGLTCRVPVGIQWFALDNLELFAEIVPGLELIPATGLELDGGIGIRFYVQ